MTSHLIYSQIYTAIARTLLKLDRHYDSPNKFYSPEWHSLITRIAIYESRGFVNVVQFGLTPSKSADLWLNKLQHRHKLVNAIATIAARHDTGPWDPIRVMETLPLAIIHCRLLLGDREVPYPPHSLEPQALWWAPEALAYKFIDSVRAFEQKHLNPRLNLSQTEIAQMPTAPGEKQIGLEL